jgi:hypothetical protein
MAHRIWLIAYGSSHIAHRCREVNLGSDFGAGSPQDYQDNEISNQAQGDVD